MIKIGDTITMDISANQDGSEIHEMKVTGKVFGISQNEYALESMSTGWETVSSLEGIMESMV